MWRDYLLRTTRKWRARCVWGAQAASLSFAAACRELACRVLSVLVAKCIRPATECYTPAACAPQRSTLARLRTFVYPVTMADKPSKLKIADREFTSRLIVGTGKFASNELMRDALIASG